MDTPARFQAKRDGVDGAVVRDNLTGRTVATFHPDPAINGMARRFAEAAAEESNRLYEAYVGKRKKMGL